MQKKDRLIQLELSEDELSAVQGALAQICYGPYAIEDWEFHTLVGVRKKYAEALLDRTRKDGAKAFGA